MTALFFFLGFVCLLILGLRPSYNKENETNQSFAKIKDSEIIRIVARSGIITAATLSAATDMERETAARRLDILSKEGVLKIVDSLAGGYIKSYVLKGDSLLALSDIKIEISRGQLTESELIAICQKIGGRVSVAAVCMISGLSVRHVKSVLSGFAHSGALTVYKNKDQELVYVLNKFLLRKIDKSFAANGPEGETVLVNDAKVIGAAVEADGVLTAAGLCFKLNIPVDTAQKLLNELTEKGVFEILPGFNKSIEYHLKDKTILN